jgi:hypothetical protein
MKRRDVRLPEAFAVSGVENGIFAGGKTDSMLPENAPTVGSAWIISPSN